jgi:hypothetical protein
MLFSLNDIVSVAVLITDGTANPFEKPNYKVVTLAMNTVSKLAIASLGLDPRSKVIPPVQVDVYFEEDELWYVREILAGHPQMLELTLRVLQEIGKRENEVRNTLTPDNVVEFINKEFKERLDSGSPSACCNSDNGTCCNTDTKGSPELPRTEGEDNTPTKE